MPKLSVAQFAAATLAVFGVSATCLARPAGEADAPHVMTVQLPGGGVAQITYFGNVAPRIAVDPQELSYPAPAVAMAPGYALADPFLAMDRMMAAMDAETAVMMRQAAALAAAPMPGPGDLIEANMADAPAGATSTTYVASFGGSGVCTQSVQVISAGPGLRPRVVSQSSGDCGSVARAPQRARMYVPDAPAPAARLVQARADSRRSASPYAGMLHPAVIYTQGE